MYGDVRFTDYLGYNIKQYILILYKMNNNMIQHGGAAFDINVSGNILNVNKTPSVDLDNCYSKIKSKNVFPSTLANPTDFFKYVFTADANKDNTPLQKLAQIWGTNLQGISGDDLKKYTKLLIQSCLDNFELISKDILRFKNYKDGMNPDVKLKIIESFLGCSLDIIYDCGLDPNHIMNVKTDASIKYEKTGNISSDLFDPHSGSSDGKNPFPKQRDGLIMNESVFSYFGLPRQCRLETTTGLGGGSTKYTSNSSFTVNGVNLIQNIKKYFAGNKQKKEQFKDDVEENARLVIGKYIGDFLQILIHFIKSLVENVGQTCKVISTCDMIVFLRAYFLGLACFLFTIDRDDPNAKITHFHIYNPNLSTDLAPKYEELAKIFVKEKELIIAEYENFIALVKHIHAESKNSGFNNICIAGSNTTYKFQPAFYEAIIADLNAMRGAIDGFVPTAPAQIDATAISSIRQYIDYLRAYKVNDIFKCDKRNSSYYVMSMAKHCTKGLQALPTRIFTSGFVSATGKSNNATYFDIGCKDARYKLPISQSGGSPLPNANMMQFQSSSMPPFQSSSMQPFQSSSMQPLQSSSMQPLQSAYAPSFTTANLPKKSGAKPDTTDIDIVMHEFFDMSAYKPDDTNVYRKTRMGSYNHNSYYVDLHKQFYKDFEIQFLKYIKQNKMGAQFLLIQRLYSHLYGLDIKNIYLFMFFDCFSDVINSIYLLDIKLLDIKNPHYYSENSIYFLIKSYFEDNENTIVDLSQQVFAFNNKASAFKQSDLISFYKKINRYFKKYIKTAKKSKSYGNRMKTSSKSRKTSSKSMKTSSKSRKTSSKSRKTSSKSRKISSKLRKTSSKSRKTANISKAKEIAKASNAARQKEFMKKRLLTIHMNESK